MIVLGVDSTGKTASTAIVRDEKSILPISTILHGEYGISDTVLSVPALVGAGGVERVVPISMSEPERKMLCDSAEILRETLKGIQD